MNNRLRLEEPWSEVKEKLKEINTHLTDEDLDYEPGKEDELLERLSGKLHLDKDHLREWIESVSSNKGKAS
jgi:hypothetical protein